MLYERIIAACLSLPWAVHPDKLRVIESFLSRKARGEAIPEAEVLAAQSQRKATGPTPPGGVGLVAIYGTLVQRADLMTEYSGGTSTDAVGQQIDALASDSNIKAIVLDVDSPGGSVYGVAELGAKIAAAAEVKKVIAVVNSEAASGAYWIASQASELVVTPSGQAGSIGVFMMHVDSSEALKLAGQAVTIVKAGERKAVGNPYAPLGAEGLAEFTEMVDDYYDQFVKAVAQGRDVSMKAVRDGFGKGGMVRAEQAVKEGMADRVGTLDEVLGRYGLSAADVSPAMESKRPALEVRKRRLQVD